MGALLWMIVIGVFIYRAIKKNPEMQKKVQQNQAAPTGTAGEKRAMTARDRARLEEYRRHKATGGQAAAQPQKQEQAMPEIVTRAKANSARYAADETLLALEREHQHSEHVSPAGAKHADLAETKRAHTDPEEFVDPPEEESLLGSVEDLMVKGYDGNMRFERDFLGEAMDMLSSFTYDDCR